MDYKDINKQAWEKIIEEVIVGIVLFIISEFPPIAIALYWKKVPLGSSMYKYVLLSLIPPNNMLTPNGLAPPYCVRACISVLIPFTTKSMSAGWL